MAALIPVLVLAPQPDGRPHPLIRADSPEVQVLAETGGEPLTVLRTRKAVLECVTSPGWVIAAITEDGKPRAHPVLGADRQDNDGGMLVMDPPAHSVFRRPVNRVFARDAAEAARGYAGETAYRLAQGLRGRTSADLAADYADPFAAAVICQSMGLPLAEWRHVLAGSVNAFSPVHGPAAITGTDEAWQEAYRFYGHAVTRDLADGTVAQIARAFPAPRFTLGQVAHVLGNVGGGYPALRQSLRRLLREMAGDYRACVDACLRRKMSWAALTGLILNTRALFPLDVARRCASPDGAWLDGRFFAPGELTLPSLAAAAEDGLAGDIAFSHGRHGCPGKWLVRMQLRVAAEVLFTLHPDLVLDGDEGPQDGDTLAAPMWSTVTGLSRA